MRKRFPKRVCIRIYDPDNIKYGGLTYTADPGKVYTDKAVDEILVKTMVDIEKNFPSLKYRIIPIGNYCYNFVCDGFRSVLKTEDLNQKGALQI
jgi:hypothetical protein